jgi:hypothetical protein
VPVRLQDRDEQILQHLRRYRIATPEALNHLFFPNQTEEAMKSTLKRLRRTDSPYIESAKLYPRGNQVYYHLAPAGAAHVGVSEKMACPVEQEALVRLLGQMLFCCVGPRLRPKFTAEEFSRSFPGVLVPDSRLAQRFPYDGYFLDVDEDGVRRLGRMLVENGGSPILVRAKKHIEEDEQALAPFVTEGRYTLALVAASAPKAAQVHHELARQPLGEIRPVRVIVEAYEQLLGLLAGAA